MAKVRVHMSAKTAAVAGIGFVATTRVRHPWDLVFEEDLPEYADFMRARHTTAFRERRRFELRLEARASRTLRKYGYCEADLWTADESHAAERLLDRLNIVRAAQAERLRGLNRVVDDDTWLWGEDGAPCVSALAEAVDAEAGDDDVARRLLTAVADRLLDRKRVRCVTPEEREAARELAGGDAEDFSDVVTVEEVRERLRAAAALLSQERPDDGVELRGRVADMMVDRWVACGRWDGRVFDVVEPSLGPLHMSAVKEAMGALVPPRLHGSLDKAARRMKDAFGDVRGGCALRMDKWVVNVRSESALAEGRLERQALEFFLKVARQLCSGLDLPMTVASAKVGEHVGAEENPEHFARVAHNWTSVWDASSVSDKKELLMVVAVDALSGSGVPQDWIFVRVQGGRAGEALGRAESLHVCVYDRGRREVVAGRIARNIDALLRPIQASDGRRPPPVVDFGEAPHVRVPSQRIAGALGLLLGHVGRGAGSGVLDASAESFVPDVCRALRGAFASFRAGVGARGARDVMELLQSDQECRSALDLFGVVPRADVSGPSAAGAGQAMWGVPGRAAGEAGEGEGLEGASTFSFATWNIAGGHRAAVAPQSWTARDQRAAVLGEVLRWRQARGCDVVALQECEGGCAYEELSGEFNLAGVAQAHESRGYVHLYVRHGLRAESVAVPGQDPFVLCRVQVPGDGGADGGADGDGHVHVAAVHLPTDASWERRRAILGKIVAKCGDECHRLLIVGDMNSTDAQVQAAVEQLRLRDAWYEGRSWGCPGNKFYSGLGERGAVGQRRDRVLFGADLWSEVHLVGKGKVFFEGSEFHMSDHYGLFGYVRAHACFGSREQKMRALAQRARVVLQATRDQSQRLEGVEVQSRLQRGREAAALARQQAQERDREAYLRTQQRAAGRRQRRREQLVSAAFGPQSLFALNRPPPPPPSPAPLPPPLRPADMDVPNVDGIRVASWDSVRCVPVRGMPRPWHTCYVVSVTQLMLRTPAVLEWLRWHSEQPCEERGTGRCCVCGMWETYNQLCSRRWQQGPVSVLRRTSVDCDDDVMGQPSEFNDPWQQQDVFAYWGKLMTAARQGEIWAGRFALRDGDSIRALNPGVTCVDQMFGFVVEKREKCDVCTYETVSYEADDVLKLRVHVRPGGPLMLQELYCDFCAPEDVEKSCPGCCRDEHARVKHVRQMRVVGLPQVLVVQLRRGAEAREPVWVEEQLRLPGLPQMQLVGVVYHNGRSLDTGHYTSLCRVHDGRYFLFDDDQPPRLMRDEPAHIKQKEAYMAVYCRMERGQGQGAGAGATEVDGAREVRGSDGGVPGGGDASTSGGGGGGGSGAVGGDADGAAECEGGRGRGRPE